MIYFVTEARLKDFTVILGNVDAKIISPLIPTLAEMWIKNRVGSYFYAHLLSVYNSQTANSSESELIELIQNSLLWRAAADVALTSAFALTNKGPQEQSGSFSTPAGLTNVSLISKHYSQKADFYDARIKSFLNLNKDLFPQFTARENNDCTIVDLPPQKDTNYGMDINFL